MDMKPGQLMAMCRAFMQMKGWFTLVEIIGDTDVVCTNTYRKLIKIGSIFSYTGDRLTNILTDRFHCLMPRRTEAVHLHKRCQGCDMEMYIPIPVESWRFRKKHKYQYSAAECWPYLNADALSLIDRDCCSKCGKECLN